MKSKISNFYHINKSKKFNRIFISNISMKFYKINFNETMLYQAVWNNDLDFVAILLKNEKLDVNAFNIILNSFY